MLLFAKYTQPNRKKETIKPTKQQNHRLKEGKMEKNGTCIDMEQTQETIRISMICEMYF